MNKSVLNIMIGCVVIIVLALSGCKKDAPEPTIDELKNLTTLPELTYPTNNAVEIPTSFTFEWNASTWSDGKNYGNFTYDVLYGINNPPTTKVSLSEGVAEFSASGIDLKTTYYWRIRTLRDGNVLKESEVFSFTTEKGLPPTSPSLIFPANSATDCSINPLLKWSFSTDPEVRNITYDVYLDNSSNPQTRILENQTSTSIKIPTCLNGETQYFWKIVAKDPQGNEAVSEIRSFTTVAKGWIPDANFRTYLKTNFQNAFQEDTLITNHADVTSFNGKIDVASKNISSLKGIEYFTGVTILQCSFNPLYSLNVSKNTSLKELYFNQNRVSSINLNTNVALENLSCQYNEIESIDLSKNVNLKRLVIDFNNLSSLDLSSNVVLNTLWCFENMLTSLDISSQTSLSDLSIGAGTNAGWVSHSNLLTMLKVNDAVKNHQQVKDGKTNLPNLTIEVYSGGVKTCSNYNPNANGGTGTCITP